MPSPFPVEAAIDTFNSTIRHKAQQDVSRFRGATRVEHEQGERNSFDQLEATNMAKRNGRHQLTNWEDPDGDRRWVISDPYDKAFMIDKPEKIRLLVDPTSEYVQAMVKGAARAMDDVVIVAFTAATVSGRAGTATTAYDTTMDITSGSVGFTFEKALNALENLNETEEDENDRYVTFQARQLRDILNLTEFTSADFNTMRALQKGRLDDFLGFGWIRSERLPVISSERVCFYWQKTAMVLNVPMEAQSTIDRLPEHRNSIGVQTQLDMGAARMRETGVGRLFCTES